MGDSSLRDLCSEVRGTCAEVAARARSVRIDLDRVAEYAAALPESTEVPQLDADAHYLEGSHEEVTAFVLCNNAINFGSGWWPTIRKREGRSGYLTIASRLTDRFRRHGPWPADALAELDSEELAATLDQDADHELMELYAASLRDLATHVRDEAHGKYGRILADANRSAVALATRLSSWDCFADVSGYGGLRVPFYKRAQLTAADLRLAVGADFGDWRSLTLFADNLIPHVLAIDGVLVLDADLARRIENGELLEHDSEEEVELRACAVHAAELLAATTGHRLCPAEIDMVLWTRGQQPSYKARARPRARTTAY